MFSTLKNRTLIRRTVFALILSAGPEGAHARQSLPAHHATPARAPALFERHFEALGRRARAQDQTVYDGEFMDAITGQRFPVQVAYQTPGWVRLEGFRPGRRIVSFDGERAAGVVTKNDEVLLEIFTGDTPEGMFSSIVGAIDERPGARGAAAVRLLGARFGPDPKTAPADGIPRYDLYEVTAPVVSRADRRIRMKVFFFESDSGLLHKASYQDHTVSPAVEVETRFSAWRTIDGSRYPFRIERFEDGRPVFTFTVAGVVNRPRMDSEYFR